MRRIFVQEFRSNSGQCLGKIVQRSDGKHELRSKSGTMLGTYCPRMNETRNRSGIRIGSGNLLSSLL